VQVKMPDHKSAGRHLATLKAPRARAARWTLAVAALLVWPRSAAQGDSLVTVDSAAAFKQALEGNQRFIEVTEHLDITSTESVECATATFCLQAVTQVIQVQARPRTAHRP
jgi:hypothetical protein